MNGLKEVTPFNKLKKIYKATNVSIGHGVGKNRSTIAMMIERSKGALVDEEGNIFVKDESLTAVYRFIVNGK